jgi:predicted membrane-bound spermidine synthase
MMNKSIQKYYLFLTLFITGAAVMVLELAGTRVVAPIYGSGLFVWASLITVALTCLAIGYWIGGKIADKKPKFSTFYLIILMGGILIAPVSQISSPILKLTASLGLRIGPLFSAYILFALPLVLLGMVSPYAIKLSTTELNVLGATAGKLYAISTMGSFFGTLLAGFILIPNMGTKKIFFLQSLILILLWIGYHLINKKYFLGLSSAVLLGFPILFLSPYFFSHKESDKVKLVYKSESIYGQLKVFEEGNQRKLYLDNMRQSSIHKYTYLPTGKVYYFFEALPLFNPRGKDALLIGLAGGNIPRRLWEYGIKTDCIDIEPKMEYIARKYFGFLDYFGKIYIADGRSYINNTKKKYDFVIIDVFTGEDVPFHLLTEECFREIKRLLRKDGILGINFLGEIYGKNSSGWKSVYQTLHQVFPYVKAFSLLQGSKLTDAVANVILFASTTPLEPSEDIKPFCKGRLAQYIVNLFLKCKLNIASDEGIILTDDYSPIEFLRKNVARKIRQRQIYYEPERYFLE